MALIIIDYDETFTSDKDLWCKFIYDAKKRGHTVICCTLRFGNEFADRDVIWDMSEIDVPVIFAAREPDKHTAVGRAGYDLEKAIWIDDSPECIVT